MRREQVINVVSEGPLPVGSLRWRLATGEPAITVICKATYLLEPVEAPLAPQQDELNEEDNHWDDDPARSLRAASDFVPFKARAEVVLVGHAFAPRKQAVRSFTTRLLVGSVDKIVEVHADRSWTLDGELREGAPVTKIPLRYERAAGGPETSNPAGIRFDIVDTRGAVAVPNLQPPGVVVSRRGERFDPIGFGPVAPTWPPRREKLHRHAEAWWRRDWSAHPLPADFDPAYFNVAPRDQQLDALRPNERIVLDGLHPDHARLVTTLAGARPRAMVQRPGRPADELSLRCETLCIDTDRSTCTLVWRGSLPLAHVTEEGRIVVTSEAAGPADVLLSRNNGTGTLVHWSSSTASRVLPFADGGERLAPPPAVSPHAGALPFVRPTPPGNVAVTLPPPVSPLPPMTPPPMTPPPVSPPPVSPPPPAIVSAIAPAPWMPVEAKLERESIGQKLSAEAQGTEEKAAAEKRGGALPPAPIVSSAAGAVLEAPEARVDDGAAKRGWKPAGAPKGVSAPLARNAPSGSALEASNAAAGAAVRAPALAVPAPATVAAPQGTAPRDAIELVWLDPAFVPRMRRRPGWKEFMAQAKPRPNDDDVPGEAPPEKRQEARDRREAFALLARGEAIDWRGIEAAIASALGEDGMFVPPLVLVAGELELPFDEVEALKATIAAVTPLVAGDTRLQAAVDTAQKVLQTPWLGGASEIAEGLTAKIKEAFALGNRALPPRYLEQHTERMLLRQRAYQKRTLLGKECIRGVLALALAGGGAAEAVEGVPVYLPASLGQELPGFLRFAVRMVAEARTRVDQYEAQEVALRGVALGRVLGAVGRRA